MKREARRKRETEEWARRTARSQEIAQRELERLGVKGVTGDEFEQAKRRFYKANPRHRPA